MVSCSRINCREFLLANNYGCGKIVEKMWILPIEFSSYNKFVPIILSLNRLCSTIIDLFGLDPNNELEMPRDTPSVPFAVWTHRSSPLTPKNKTGARKKTWQPKKDDKTKNFEVSVAPS